MDSEDKKHRSHLPMASRERTGLVTYDAKDPDTKFPPIEQLRPPKGAPNVCLFSLMTPGSAPRAPLGARARRQTLKV
jgi:hypothetical protein